MYAIHINIFQLLIFIFILPKNIHHSIANTPQNSKQKLNWIICSIKRIGLYAYHKQSTNARARTHAHTPISLAYKKCRNNETKYQYKKLLVKKKKSDLLLMEANIQLFSKFPTRPNNR